MTLDEHWHRLVNLSSADGPLGPGWTSASLAVTTWFQGRKPLPAREGLRRQVAGLVDVETRDPKMAPAAILMAGGPGAGKSGAWSSVVTSMAQQRKWRVIDADLIKDELLVASLRDGSFHRDLLPEAIRSLTATGAHFTPRELATLVHSESAFFADRLAANAAKNGQNFVLDATLQNGNRAVERVKELKNAGYDVTVVEVACSREQALHRTYQRWLDGRKRALAAAGDPTAAWNDTLGGRFVPPSFVHDLFTGPDADDAITHASAQRAFHEAGADRLLVFRVHPGEPAPVLESTQQRRSDGKVVGLEGIAATSARAESPQGRRRRPPLPERGKPTAPRPSQRGGPADPWRSRGRDFGR